jgi:phage terminase large subunit GpA-like protein
MNSCHGPGAPSLSRKPHDDLRPSDHAYLLPNASWSTLVKEYYDAKRGGPSRMQVFHNTVLGRPWRTTISRVDASMLADRAEPWGLPTSGHGMIVPENVVVITAGVDTQDDRVECALIGFSIYGAPCILGHIVFAGNTLEDGVWKTLDGFLKSRWRHPNGWMIGIDGTAIDSGGREGRTQKVYDFCYPRMDRYIFAIKGLPGPRKIWTKLTSVKGDMRAFGVAVDVLKTEVLDRLAREPFNEDGSENPQAFRLSDQLSDEFLEQVTNETRRVRFVKNRPVIEFQPKRAGSPTEGLDCTVYALAVRQSPSVRSVDLRERAARPGLERATPTWQKLRDVGAFSRHYRRHLRRVLTLTMPHHGSERNFHPDLLRQIGPALCVAAADSYRDWRHERRTGCCVCRSPVQTRNSE